MAFRSADLDQEELPSIDAVLEWAQRTQRGLARVSVDGLVREGGRFKDDGYFGDHQTVLHFNGPALGALCRILGVRQTLLEQLVTPDLATDVLNDLLDQRKSREVLADQEFVIDERAGAIIGLVSKTYVTYGNENFVRDIQERLQSLSNGPGFVFKQAFGINTALTMRFVAPEEHGSIEGRGGRGVDKSVIGLEFSNTMVGDSAVRLNYFLYRLICANGLMVPAAKAVNRIFHSGEPVSFHRRLDRSFGEMIRGLGTLRELLQALGAIPFDPELLSQDRDLTERIFEVMPSAKSELCDLTKAYLRYPANASPSEREKIRREHDARLLAELPLHYAGPDSERVFKTSFRDKATLFDLVNVFTEHAKQMSPSDRLPIEERAGGLASYLAAHARRF